MRVRTKESQVRKVVRVTAGSSVVLGMILAGSAMFTSVASARPTSARRLPPPQGVLASTAFAKESLHQRLLSARPEQGSEVQGAIAVDGNFEGDISM